MGTPLQVEKPRTKMEVEKSEDRETCLVLTKGLFAYFLENSEEFILEELLLQDEY